MTIAATSIWAAIVFFLHVVQIDSPVKKKKLIPHLDKAVHFVMFAVLAYGLMWSFSKARTWTSRAALLTFFICMAYGASLEYLQGAYFVGRDSDPLDWFADMLGTLTAILIVRRQMFKIVSLRK
jgi:VanZ family protein